MSNPFVAEIRILGCNFAPTGWAFCDGQILPLSQNTALFSLLGTTYGGNGTSTFALPNLQGSAAMFWGQAQGGSVHDIGEQGGEAAVTLLESEVPPHSHTLQAEARPATQNAPTTASSMARSTNTNFYKASSGAGTTAAMSPGALAPAGGSLPHNNMMPYQTLNFCIALQGVFPPRS